MLAGRGVPSPPKKPALQKLAAALAASSLFAAACGSSEAADVGGLTPDASAEETPATETPTSESPTSTAASAEPPTTLGFSADNSATSSEYCEIVRRRTENQAPFSIYGDPEALVDSRPVEYAGLVTAVQLSIELDPLDLPAPVPQLRQSKAAEALRYRLNRCCCQPGLGTLRYHGGAELWHQPLSAGRDSA